MWVIPQEGASPWVRWLPSAEGNAQRGIQLRPISWHQPSNKHLSPRGRGPSSASATAQHLCHLYSLAAYYNFWGKVLQSRIRLSSWVAYKKGVSGTNSLQLVSRLQLISPFDYSFSLDSSDPQLAPSLVYVVYFVGWPRPRPWGDWVPSHYALPRPQLT